MITDESWSLFRKAYLSPEGRGLSSIEGLGGSNNSSRGSGSKWSPTPSSLVKN
jgi:hypothetical protein